MVHRRKLIGRVGMLVHACYLRDARVQREAETLATMGFDVQVVCARESSRSKGLPEPPNEIVNGVHIHRIPLSPKRGSKVRYVFEYAMIMILGTWKLALLNLRKRFDVVHIHNMPDFLVVAGLSLKWTGAILVLDVHDPMNELFQANYHLAESHPMIRALKLQERISYRLANHLLTVSIPMAENVAKKAKRAKDSIKIVHNFPDVSKFPIREDRKQWPFNTNGIVFLYCGTVTEHYRLDIAVRAIAITSQTIPNIKFQILGTGNRLQQVLSLAKDLGIGDRVEHLKPVRQDRVIDIMANADVGITTHQSGTFADLYFSTKIVEFMTQGLPVISSRTSTIEKYIPENAIFYFKPEQVDDLVKQIVKMYNNPYLVTEKIRNSKKLLIKYTWEKEKSSLLSFYEELIRNNNAKKERIKLETAHNVF